jgi:aspartyl-tRNA(Asn)/glutamyl-tRNA(Gln) amidotransferase subunit A
MSATMPGHLPLHSLRELASLLDAREVTSEAIVQACLARIDAHDARLHAFVEVWHDDALAAARAADLERKAGFVRGPLHGLPIALKDLVDVTGRVTTAGSKSWRGRSPAKRTATAVQHLLEAGMILLGKTHMVEFALGSWGRNQPMGAPWNPWDMEVHRVAGGSSSGSGVAVAAGMAPVALGSDTGGSIRIPAAVCGLTGLKPTHGVVSLHGVIPLATTLDSLGPLARTVDDALLVTAAMAGPDLHDPATLAVPRIDLLAALALDPDLRGLRVAALDLAPVRQALDDDVVRAFEAAVRTFQALGAIVDVVAAPFGFDDVMTRNGRIMAAEAYTVHRDHIGDASLDIDPWVRTRMLAGKAIGAADYIHELAVRRGAIRRFEQWMQGRAALLTPAVPIVAQPLETVDEASTPLAMFTRAANYLGACALTLPAGSSREGLPVGVQLIGAAFTEPLLGTLGRGFQRETAWHRASPRMP